MSRYRHELRLTRFLRSSRHLLFFSSLLSFVFFFLLPAARVGASESIGVCWGRVARQPIPPTNVVSQLQANNITKVKLFNADPAVLGALTGTGIEVMVMVNNSEVVSVANSMEAAQQWVDQNVQTWLPYGVNIKYISVGNEPYLKNKQDVDDSVESAVTNIYNALVYDEIDDKVKVTVSFNSEILANTVPPSGAYFATNWTSQLKYIASLIANTSSVFSVNIYPFYNMYSGESKPLSASNVFFDQSSLSTNPYANVFDATFDSLLYALENASVPSDTVNVVIGEIGWPSDGDSVANLSWAQSYNQQVLAKMLTGEGTPKRPNQVIQGYLFGLFDEDAKSILPGAFERRWGIYDNHGVAKYNLDLTGGANANAVLAETPGIHLETKKWCVAKVGADTTNLTLAYNKICLGANVTNFGDKADCTPQANEFTSPGDVCGTTSLEEKSSYAFNAYFQTQDQDATACDWGGVAQVVTVDPSFGQCTFKIGINMETTEEYTTTTTVFSIAVFGYLFGLICLLSTFL